MGKDDLFKKRKAKRKSDLKRREARRKPYEKILIVCEGSKTEPNYFLSAKDHYEIDSANISIDGSSGSSPFSVVRHAIALYEEELKNDPYDKVFCVFDRDEHPCYQKAIDTIHQKNNGSNVFNAITSNPSFEYWLLLHFSYSMKPYVKTQKKSIGALVIDDLKVYIPDYEKSERNTFDKLLGSLDFAIANATRLAKTRNENPSTNVHNLVTYMRELKN